MRLTWPADRQIRSFYDPVSHRLTMLSDVVSDEAEGRVYGNRLVIAIGAQGDFLDLELGAGPVNQGLAEAQCEAPAQVNEPVAVWVPETEGPSIEALPDSSALTIRLLPAEPERWVQLTSSGLLLGLLDEDVLAAIRVVGPVLDPNGENEAQWLDSIGA
jgi:hypothetical protein